MSIVLVDSHCHLDRLDFEKLGGDVAAALERARTQGVMHLLCVCIDMDNYPDVLRIAQAHPQVYASVGVHPNARDTRDPSVEELVTMAADGRVVAIGETGLDYFHGQGELEWQCVCFCCLFCVVSVSGSWLFFV